MVLRLLDWAPGMPFLCLASTMRFDLTRAGAAGRAALDTGHAYPLPASTPWAASAHAIGWFCSSFMNRAVIRAIP